MRFHRVLAAALVRLGWNEAAYRLSAPHAWLTASGHLRARRPGAGEDGSGRAREGR